MKKNTIIKYLLITLFGLALIIVSVLLNNERIDVILSYVIIAYIICICIFTYPFGTYISLGFFIFELVGGSIRHGHILPLDYIKSITYLFYAIISSIISIDFVKKTSRLNNDIIDISMKEKFIRENQKNYLRLFNHLDEIIWLLDTDFNILQTNDTIKDFLGYTVPDILGNSLLDYFSNTDKNKIRFELLSTLDNNSYVKSSFLRKDSSLLLMETRIRKSLWHHKEIYFAVSHDITERQADEDSRQQTEAKFMKVFDVTPAMICISSLIDDRYLDVNKSFLTTLGYTKEEIIGKSTFEIEIFSNLAERENYIKQVVEKGHLENKEVKIKAKDGKNLHVAFIAEKVELSGECCILTVMIDITERISLNTRLTHQSRVLYGISFASNILLTETNFDKAIQEALPVMGRALNTDHVILFKFDNLALENTNHFELIWKWTKNQLMEKELENLLHLPDNSVSREWFTTLKNGRNVIASANSGTPEEKQILELMGIKSSLLAPIFVDSTYWGVLAFIDCIAPREWTKGDEVTLMPLSAAIGGVLSRNLTVNALHIAKEFADQANMAKSSFLATMSHEIRTPMNGVLGMSNLLKQTNLDSEQSDYVNIIRLSGEALLDIINDILDFSKIESGKFELDTQHFNIRTCIEDVLDLMAVKSAEKRLELLYSISPDIKYQVKGDSLRLRQILVNLIGNAIKFTHVGYIYLTIDLVTTDSEDIFIRFTIQDTGIGISKANLDNMFKPFSQADSSTSRIYGGTGLGLAISKKLVEMMHGEIGVESEQGVGTSFHFTIKTQFIKDEPLVLPNELEMNIPAENLVFVFISNPLMRKLVCEYLNSIALNTYIIDDYENFIRDMAKYPLFTTGIVDINDVVEDINQFIVGLRNHPPYKDTPFVFLRAIGVKTLSNEEYYNPINYFMTKPIKYRLMGITFNQALNKKQETDESRNTVTLNSKFAKSYPHNILVVDDNIINQKLMINVLSKLGYRADVAGNGLEGLNLIKKNSYDIVFMDVVMPEMDGFEATKNVRHSKTIKTQPRIYAMTAHAMQGDKDKCIEAGMDDYISKPVHFEDVIKVLKSGE